MARYFLLRPRLLQYYFLAEMEPSCHIASNTTITSCDWNCKGFFRCLIIWHFCKESPDNATEFCHGSSARLLHAHSNVHFPRRATPGTEKLSRLFYQSEIQVWTKVFKVEKDHLLDLHVKTRTKLSTIQYSTVCNVIYFILHDVTGKEFHDGQCRRCPSTWPSCPSKKSTIHGHFGCAFFYLWPPCP